MKYIMIIDDSPTIRMSVEFAVKKTGYPTYQAENGRIALQKISEYKKEGREPALCVCDVNMPEMDGISFIKEFRATDKFTPVLILTTESENSMINEGKASGASGWLIKPFRPEDLIKAVEKFVR